MVMPRAQVAPPPPVPYRYGLQSVVLPRNDTRWEDTGVEYWPETACGPREDTYWLNQDCVAPGDRIARTKDLAAYPCPPVTEGTPFTVFRASSRAGNPYDDVKSRLLAEFAAVEPVLVERAFLLGDPDGAASPTLAGAVLAPAGETATGIVGAVAALEQGFYAGNTQQGVIHAPRWLYPYAAAAQLVVRDRQQLRTPADTLWAFGVGYDDAAGPTAGTLTAAGLQAWMYMTGPVSQWRSEVVTNPPDSGSAFDRATNNIELVAERTYVLAFDCDAVAVLADVTPVAAGGGGF